MPDKLGFSVACHRGDLPLLRGCLASIRYFAPDAPIALVIDRDFDTRSFVRRYGVLPMRRSALKNKALTSKSFGYGLTKLAALWEAPFDRLIHVDADVVLWGDIRMNLPDTDWDFVYNEPHEVITEHVMHTQYFDPDVVFQRTRSFPWQGREYFNTGVFACRVGSFDLEEMLNLLDLLRDDRNPFPLNDQGILNLLVFRMVSEGRLRAEKAHLQTVVPVVAREELEKRFRFENGKPLTILPPTAVHWAGPKPYKTNPNIFSLPMDFFREIGMRDLGLPAWMPSGGAMRWDEFLNRTAPVRMAELKKRVKKLIGRPS